MFSMIKMVVFDMAGTTVNEQNLVYKKVQLAVNEAGFDFSLNTVLEHAAGKEKLDAIKAVLASDGIINDTLAENIFANFKTKLAEAYQTEPIAEQPHATNVFHALKEKQIAIVLNTGYNRPTAEALIERIGWKRGIDYDALVTASDVSNGRPMPDMIKLAQQQLNIVDSSEVAKIGDSAIDVEEGKNANCGLTIGITTGAHTHDQLQTANPDYIINDLQELLAIIEKASIN